jgi:AraC-like DNA-binding protein
VTMPLAPSAISTDVVWHAHRRVSQLLERRWQDAPMQVSTPSRFMPAWFDKTGKRETSLLKFAHMLEMAAEQSGSGCLGLDMARIDSPHETGIFKALAVHAPTVGRAIEDLVRFFPLIQTGTSVSLERVGTDARFLYRIHDPSIANSLQDCAYTLGKVFRRFRAAAGDAWRLDDVSIAMQGPSEPHRYCDFFQTRVRFGQRQSALRFPATVLTTRIHGANADAYARLCAELERGLRTRCDTDVLEDAIRAWMLQASRRWIAGTLEQAAADFGVTPRTLQRRLKERGIGFLDLRAQVRMEQARELLADNALSVTSIAQRLGFSETSAFTRAFRNHARQSPRAFRREAVALA